MKSMQAGEFKAKCLQIMDEVHDLHVSYLITKHGKPIARLVPIEQGPVSAFGCLKGTVSIASDVVKPIDEDWEANQ